MIKNSLTSCVGRCDSQHRRFSPNKSRRYVQFFAPPPPPIPAACIRALLFLITWSSLAQTHYVTPSPTSPGDGSGSTAWNAKPFKIYDLQQDWVGNTSKSDITIVFLAGNEGEFYGFGSEANPYSHKITIFGSPPVNTTAPEYGQTVVGPRPNRKVRLIGVPDPVTGRLPKLKMLLPP